MVHNSTVISRSSLDNHDEITLRSKRNYFVYKFTTWLIDSNPTEDQWKTILCLILGKDVNVIFRMLSKMLGMSNFIKFPNNTWLAKVSRSKDTPSHKDIFYLKLYLNPWLSIYSSVLFSKLKISMKEIVTHYRTKHDLEKCIYFF